MQFKKIMLLFGILITGLHVLAQDLKPGFDKEEYRELMLISVRSTASVKYYSKFPEPKRFKMIYQSPVMGLDNLWDLWTDNQNNAVVSTRGTTQQSASWLANLYAAMVPATGKLQINNKETFSYTLAQNPRAAVHVGWLLGMAYLSNDILPRIQTLYKTGTRNILLMGHSQGGAISFLLTAHFHNLQKQKLLPADIQFKTYCSAAPKPGNLYFAYDYEAATQAGWSYNVVNAADWVPEMPISIQTIKDFNNTNPFKNAKPLIKKIKFPGNIALRYVFNRLRKPTSRAQAKYEKYLGRVASKAIRKNVKGFKPPRYFHSSDYVRTSATIVLLPDSAYYKKFPDDDKQIFIHHIHKSYLYLLDKLKL